MSRKHTKGGDDTAQNPSKWASIRSAIKSAWGTEPTNVEGQFAVRTEFYKEQLRLVLKSLIEIECPDNWDTDYFLDVLFFEGKICVFDSPMGVIPLRCGTFGVNVYERNSGVNIENPVLGHFERTDGVDCVVVYLMDNKWFRTFNPIVSIFAEKLAACDSGIEVNIMNSKVAWIVNCADSKTATEMKMIYDKVSRGEPAVFYESSDITSDRTTEFFNANVKQQYVADLLQSEKRAIMNEFLTMVGINNGNVEKKERLIVDEVSANNAEIECNIARIRKNLERCEERVNAMFGGRTLHFKFPYWDQLEESGAMGNGIGANIDKPNDAV